MTVARVITTRSDHLASLRELLFQIKRTIALRLMTSPAAMVVFCNQTTLRMNVISVVQLPLKPVIRRTRMSQQLVGVSLCVCAYCCFPHTLCCSIYLHHIRWFVLLLFDSLSIS